MLIGRPALQTLKQSHVAVFGVGGVGGYVVEVLARSGVGAIDIFDNDTVCASNLNRQIIATQSVVGKYKVEVCQQRILDINPDCKVTAHKMFYLPSNADEINLQAYDYVVDCIDTVAAKIELIKRCHALQVPLMCSMGAANKMDPTQFKVCDLTKTIMDPLAKILRKKLRKVGITHVKVVFSPEIPLSPIIYPSATDGEASPVTNDNQRPVPASNSFVPAAAGIICGGEVVKDLIRHAGTGRPDWE